MPTLQQLKDAAPDDPRLQSLAGKTAIVSLYQFHDGEPYVRSQECGEIAGLRNGLMVYHAPEGEKGIPIEYKALVIAPRGEYTLDATEEKVVNPDFLVSWRLDFGENYPEPQWECVTAPNVESIVGKLWEFEYAYDEDYLKRLIETRSEDFIGKTVLAGIRRFAVSDSGERCLIEQKQHFGVLARVSFPEGVVLQFHDGSELTLPPDLSLFEFAPPGEFTLKSTGEVIVNPDLITMWVLERREEE